MIKSLKVVNSYGEELTMTLKNPRESGYIISGITGLDPVNVDIKQTQLVSGLKYKYNKGFHKYRDITLSIIYDEWNNKSIEELRSNLYRYFMTDDLVELYFIKDGNYALGNYVKNDGSMQPGNYGITDEYGNVVNFTLRSDGFFYLNDSTYDGAVLRPFVDENYTETETAYIDAFGRLYWNGSETTIWFWENEIQSWGYFNIISQSYSNLDEIRTIKGHVSAHNATYFSQSCGAQITITCSDPWFREVEVIDGEYVETKIVESSTSSTSEGFINTAVINYKGDIQNGFLLKTETSVHNLHGEGLSITSNRQNVGDTGKAMINIPENYPDINVTPDILMADFRNDSVAISTSHDNDAGLPTFLCGGSLSWSEEDEHIFEEVNTSTPITFTAMYADNAKMVDTENAALTLFFDINDTELEGLEELEFEIIWDGSEHGTIKGIPQYSALAGKYLLLITECDAPGSEFTMRDDMYESLDCGIGYIPSDKEWIDNGTPNNYGTQSEPMDHIGWLDATSISKRQELPKLVPGNNTVTFTTSSKESCKFKIEYSTLYRGL